MVSAGAEDREKPKMTPVLLHQLVDGGCELVQQSQFLQYRDYSAVAIEGVPGEAYSLELAQADFIQPTVAGGKVPKSASKAGFVVKASDEGNSPDLPRVVPVFPSNECPSVEEAVTRAAKQRDRRRATVQSKLYRPGVDDVTRPIPESSPQPKSDAKSDGTKGVMPPSGKPKVTHGTVVLAIAIGPDGEVKDAKVARSLDPWLDMKAIEAVRSWRFHPARKQGLPVAVLMTVDVNFNLHE
jgi:TonB family protein